MQTRTRVQTIWQPHSSGLTIPNGTHSDFSSSSSETYLQIKEKAKSVEALYRDSDVPLPRNCDLSKLISDAKILSDAWFLNNKEVLTIGLLFRVLHLNRIAEAILPLRTVPDRAKYLASLTSGNLNLFQRHRSLAKNILWELELWSSLREKFPDASLSEPDILVRVDKSTVGIACKKLYSEKHLQNVLSEAVSQVESHCDVGIVAVNLDELVPPNTFLRRPSLEITEQSITDINNRFLVSHDRHFRKYLASGRLIAALVSTAVVAHIPGNGPAWNNIRRASVWTIPGLPVEKEKILRIFYSKMMN
jgi:hypothetical protein